MLVGEKLTPKLSGIAMVEGGATAPRRHHKPECLVALHIRESVIIPSQSHTVNFCTPQRGG